MYIHQIERGGGLKKGLHIGIDRYPHSDIKHDFYD